MNILVIGDPHFKVCNAKEMTSLCDQIIELVKTRHPDFIVILGDTLDRHESIHMSPLCQSVEFLRQLQDLSFLYVIIGNHDRKNNRDFLSDEHPFTALKYWNNTQIIDVVKIIKITKNQKKYKFTMVPYVYPGRFMEALDTVSKWENSTCIFCHQEFEGAQMGPVISIDGDKWSPTLPYIISGHIHDYHKVHDNILYVGTPIQHKFGDSDDKIIIFLTIDQKITNHDNCIYEKIALKLPLKKIIHLNVADVPTFRLQNNIDAKIYITGTSSEIKCIMKHKNITKWKKRGMKIIYKDIPLSTSIPQTKIKENFTTLLFNNIKNNPDLSSLFDEIFITPIPQTQNNKL